MASIRSILAATFPALFLAACGEPPTASYTAPADKPATPTPTPAAPNASATAASAPSSDAPANLPPGWTAKPASTMRLASFNVTDSSGATADLSVSALAGDGGGVLPNINRWRGQAGLEPLDEQTLASQTEKLTLRGAEAVLADATGHDPKTGGPVRILAIIIPQPNRTLFFKMTGDPGVIQGQREALVHFADTFKLPE